MGNHAAIKNCQMKGKIIGAILGGLAAGPWGAAIGVAAGHFFDSANAGEGKREISGTYSLFYAVAKLAKIDGHVSESEIREIERIFSDLGFSAEMRSEAIRCFRSAKSDSMTFYDALPQLAAAFPARESRGAVFSILMRVALADGRMNPSVADAMREAARVLEIDWDGGRSAFSASPGMSELSEAYAVLGVSPSASDAEIKKMYRAKCMDLHPDTLRSKGIGEYAVTALENELRRVNDAYDLIQKHRKIR